MSIVEAPWRALMNAALWNGHPHHSTTGVARISCTQPLLLTSMPGTMPSTTTGTVSTAALITSTRENRGVLSAGGPESAGSSSDADSAAPPMTSAP